MADSRYRIGMKKEVSGYTPPPELERYIELCQRIYERMEREGGII